MAEAPSPDSGGATPDACVAAEWTIAAGMVCLMAPAGLVLHVRKMCQADQLVTGLEAHGQGEREGLLARQRLEGISARAQRPTPSRRKTCSTGRGGW
jgi:hypothetical protein